jgi:hypothetical protein
MLVSDLLDLFGFIAVLHFVPLLLLLTLGLADVGCSDDGFGQ